MKTKSKTITFTENEIRTALGAIRFSREARKALGVKNVRTLEKVYQKLAESIK